MKILTAIPTAEKLFLAAVFAVFVMSLAVIVRTGVTPLLEVVDAFLSDNIKVVAEDDAIWDTAIPLSQAGK